jgi:outer membrane protein OmpA-like peptidoglycan-associated protein
MPGHSDYYNASSLVKYVFREDGSSGLSWWLLKPDVEDFASGEKALGLSSDFSDYNVKDNPLKPGEWNHFAFSFNKRAFKGYINGIRLINVPAMRAPGYFYIYSGAFYKYSGISNVRIAKGAVPLYDRLLSDGKITSYGITFATGKADLKPESMTEIARIAKLMAEHPELSFEVQGHCDATGSDAVNDSLSQKRAEAVVAALVQQGIAAERLSAVGKGSHVPVADNSTDEGRAKNRRVEFVKK